MEAKTYNVFNRCLEKCFTTVNSLSMSCAINSKIHTRPGNNKWFFVASLAKLTWGKFSFQLQRGCLWKSCHLSLKLSLYLFQETCTATGAHNEQGTFQTYTNKCFSFRSPPNAKCAFWNHHQFSGLTIPDHFWGSEEMNCWLINTLS